MHSDDTDGGPPLSILMIEDSAAYAKLITAQLGATFPVRHRLTHCVSLEEGREAIAARSPDLIILDLFLPDSYGLETFRETHALAPDTPIVILSSDDSEDNAVEALRAGADDYLVKGGDDRVALIRSLRFALERRRRLVAERELGAARIIQQSLLPAGDPRIEGFEMAGAMYSAIETAGDYYDFLCDLPAEPGERHIGVVVADVSGHGCGPAMLMSEMRGCIHALTRAVTDPAEILSLAHDVIGTDRHSHFVTMFLGRIDCCAPSLTYAGAGHEGCLLPAAGEPRFLPSTGMPLGIEDTSWDSVGPIPLEPRDMIVVTTDGFAEAVNPAGEQFGRRRLMQFFDQRRSVQPAALVEELYRHVREFTAGVPQHDDMAVVVVQAQ